MFVLSFSFHLHDNYDHDGSCPSLLLLSLSLSSSSSSSVRSFASRVFILIDCSFYGGISRIGNFHKLIVNLSLLSNAVGSLNETERLLNFAEKKILNTKKGKQREKK